MYGSGVFKGTGEFSSYTDAKPNVNLVSLKSHEDSKERLNLKKLEISHAFLVNYATFLTA